MKRVKNFLLVRSGSFLTGRLIMLWGKTIKFKIISQPHNPVVPKGQNVIYVFWHNCLMLVFFYYRSFLTEEKTCVLISNNHAGEYVTRVIRDLNLEIIRGSNKKDGKEGLRRLIQKINSGYNAWIAPDGSRGPRYKVKRGVIYLAQKTKCPIIPITFSVSRKKILNTWDRFILPAPFSRGIVILGEPIYVPQDANGKTRVKKMLDLEKSLQEITARADEYFAVAS
ncbi:lysophospholipid acyltransferase family protein [Candidatus Omnitrophota bacterium]